VILASFKKIKPANRTFSSLKLYRNKDANKHHQKTVHIKEGNVEHVGSNFGKSGEEKLIKYVIAIKDTETEEIQYI
jgi:hypothetical protein